MSRRSGQSLFTLSSIVFWLSIIGGCSKAVEAAWSSRCDVLCQIDGLREQCDRCKLRVPMRFGKRSSSPDYLLDSRNAGDQETNSISNYDDDNNILAKEIFDYLLEPQKRQLSTIVRRKRTIDPSVFPLEKQQTLLWRLLYRTSLANSNKKDFDSFLNV
ncbi:hypothetical protein CHUAL_012955 [Chamberlinius hualienensis]